MLLAKSQRVQADLAASSSLVCEGYWGYTADVVSDEKEARA